MAAIGSLASAPAAARSEREARVRAALGILLGFLALEPFVRAVVWWMSGEEMRGLLHADARFLAVTLIAATGGALVPDVRSQVLRHRWLLWPAAAWALAAVASSGIALAPNLAASHSAWWAMYLLLGLYLLAMMREHPEMGQTALLAWCVGFCAYALIVCAFIGTDPVRPGVNWIEGLPGVLNVRHLGFEAMAAALIGSLARQIGLKRRSLWIFRAAAVLGWAVLFWSGGRGHFVAVAAAMVCLISARMTFRPRRVIECLLLAAIGFGVATFHQPPTDGFGVRRTIGLTKHSSRADGSDPTSGRVELWVETATLISENLIFGVGEAQAPVRLRTTGGYFAQPHNLILQAGMAWGIVGGSAFLAAIGFVVVRGARRLRGSSMESPAAAGLAVALAMIANSMFDASMFHPRPVIMFMIGICVALSAPTSRVPLLTRPARARGEQEVELVPVPAE